MQAYFDQLDRVRYEGSKSSNPLAFAICRLLLAHLLLERGGHVWCGGV